AALVRAAQEPRAAAPRRAADARGDQLGDAPRPARDRPRDDAVLPGRLRPRAARDRLDGVATRPRDDDPRDEPRAAGQPDEPRDEEGHQLGGDHRGADGDYWLLWAERALPRLRGALGLLVLLGVDRRDVGRTVLGLQTPRLALGRAADL